MRFKQSSGALWIWFIFSLFKIIYIVCTGLRWVFFPRRLRLIWSKHIHCTVFCYCTTVHMGVCVCSLLYWITTSECCLCDIFSQFPKSNHCITPIHSCMCVLMDSHYRCPIYIHSPPSTDICVCADVLASTVTRCCQCRAQKNWIEQESENFVVFFTLMRTLDEEVVLHLNAMIYIT